MVEEIITAQSRIRWLFVIARNSSFTYKGQAIDVKQVGTELGVRYVLEGSVRRAGGRLRISAQLIEAETGAHLWADRFDGSLDDVFDLQDQVAASVAAVIEPTLQAAEISRSIRHPTVDLTAYDLYLRALALIASPRDEFARAFELLGQATERDPQYGSALALTAHYYYRMDFQSWSEDAQTTRRNALDFAQRALRHDPENPEVLSRVAIVLGYFGEDVDTAIALNDRCLELNSNYAMGWYHSAILMNWAGQPEAALERFDKYLELNPRGPRTPYLTAISISLFFCRRFEEAAAKMRECLELAPFSALMGRFLAASYAHLGRLGEAREIVQRLGARASDDGSRFRSSEHREMYLSGLRLAVGE
jgi:adenylate cyclase